MQNMKPGRQRETQAAAAVKRAAPGQKSELTASTLFFFSFFDLFIYFLIVHSFQRHTSHFF